MKYIILDKKITEWGWYTNGNAFRVFLHILMNVSEEETEFLGEMISAGSYATSIESIASSLRMSVQNVRTALKCLVSTNEISTESTNRYTLITLKNPRFFDLLRLKLTNEEQANNYKEKEEKEEKERKEPKERKRIKSIKRNIYSLNSINTNEDINTIYTNNINNINNNINNNSIYNKEIEDLFNEFWAIYPKHVNKKDSFKKFKKYKAEVIREKILPDVRSRVSSYDWTKDGGQFVPNPTTYLNQERWEDGIVERKPYYEKLD